MAENFLARYGVGGAPNMLLAPEPQQPSLMSRAWDARPWKGYAENPPSTLPLLGVALGLLHPRLGGAMRDMSMARNLATTGDMPAALPGGAIEQMLATRGGINGGHRRVVPTIDQPANVNAAAPSPYKPGSKVGAYEAYLNSLPDGQQPVSYWTFVRELMNRP